MMKRKTKGHSVQPLLPFEGSNPDIDTPQPRTTPSPPIEPRVEGECHCECPGCSGKFGAYRHCGKGGCGLPRGSS